MGIAQTVDLTSGPPSPTTTSAKRSHFAAWAVAVALAALTLALLGTAYFAVGAGDDYPEPTPQWTD